MCNTGGRSLRIRLGSYCFESIEFTVIVSLVSSMLEINKELDNPGHILM